MLEYIGTILGIIGSIVTIIVGIIGFYGVFKKDSFSNIDVIEYGLRFYLLLFVWKYYFF